MEGVLRGVIAFESFVNFQMSQMERGHLGYFLLTWASEIVSHSVYPDTDAQLHVEHVRCSFRGVPFYFEDEVWPRWNPLPPVTALIRCYSIICCACRFRRDACGLNIWIMRDEEMYTATMRKFVCTETMGRDVSPSTVEEERTHSPLCESLLLWYCPHKKRLWIFSCSHPSSSSAATFAFV